MNQGLASTQLTLGSQPALIVVDASNGFTDPSSPLGSDFEAQIDVINRLIALAEQNAWPVILSTVSYDNPQQASVFREKLPGLNYLKAGSTAVDIDARILRLRSAISLRKFHASCFHQTDLHQQLQELGVDSLVCCGFTTSGCVRATAVDGLQYNYRTAIISDATGDRDEAAHSSNLRDFGLKYGEVMTYEQVSRMAAGKL